MVNFLSEIAKLAESIINNPTELVDPFFALKVVDSQLSTETYYPTRNYAVENVGAPVYNAGVKTINYIEDKLDYIKIALVLGGIYVISSVLKK